LYTLNLRYMLDADLSSNPPSNCATVSAPPVAGPTEAPTVTFQPTITMAPTPAFEPTATPYPTTNEPTCPPHGKGRGMMMGSKGGMMMGMKSHKEGKTMSSNGKGGKGYGGKGDKGKGGKGYYGKGDIGKGGKGYGGKGDLGKGGKGYYGKGLKTTSKNIFVMALNVLDESSGSNGLDTSIDLVSGSP
jgi:hypothetical protein